MVRFLDFFSGSSCCTTYTCFRDRLNKSIIPLPKKLKKDHSRSFKVQFVSLNIKARYLDRDFLGIYNNSN